MESVILTDNAPWIVKQAISHPFLVYRMKNERKTKKANGIT